METLFPQPGVEGLQLLTDFVSEQQEQSILATLERFERDDSLKRVTWHFGRRYDYSDSLVVRKADVPAIPDEFKELGRKLVEGGSFAEDPSQVIVNQYLASASRKDGIAAHRDRADCFGPVVATISLLESWVMRFTRGSHESVDVVLPRFSCAILSGPARYDWQHGIQPRQYDRVGGVRVRRNRRVSVTFRTIVEGF